MTRSALVNIMIQVARKAGRELSRDFGEIEHLQVSRKGASEFVASANRKAEKIIVANLGKFRQGYGFVTNVTGEIDGCDKSHRWIIAPLSGIANFLHALPFFAISIALERDGQTVSGLIYNPISNELFTTEKGKGAFLNDKRLRIASRTQLSSAMIMCDISNQDTSIRQNGLEDIKIITAETAMTRSIGSVALSLAFVSTGRADAYIKRGAHICDTTAGILLVREAGGFVGKIEDQDNMMEQNDFVAGNEAIQNGLVNLLQSAKKNK